MIPTRLDQEHNQSSHNTNRPVYAVPSHLLPPFDHVARARQQVSQLQLSKIIHSTREAKELAEHESGYTNVLSKRRENATAGRSAEMRGKKDDSAGDGGKDDELLRSIV
jgi:hypothetical protein